VRVTEVLLPLLRRSAPSLEEETAECGFMASVVGPDQALTVDNDHQLKLAFAEAVLVDPDPSQPG